MLKTFTSQLLFLFILGLLIRLILAPITYHSDLLAYDFAREVLYTGHVATFYDYLPSLPDGNPLLAIYPMNQFNYPPSVYFFLGTTTFLSTYFIPYEFHQQFLFSVKDTFGNPVLFFHLFLLKLQFFFFDFGTAFLLMQFVKEKKKKLVAFGLWILNPVTLYASFMMGQFDIIPVFFTVLSLYLLLKYSSGENKWLYYSSLALGVGAAFKIWPLLLLPVLLAFIPHWKERVIAGIFAIGVYVLPILPFLTSSGFRSTALVANQTQKSLVAQIPVSGGESILLFIVSMIFFYLVFFYRKGKLENIWQRYMSILLVFFVFTHFHPQWFLWLSPFLVFELLYNRGKHLIVVLLLLFAVKGMIFLFEPGLNIQLFVPIFPAIYDGPSIFQQLSISIDTNYFRSIFHSIFTAGALYYLYAYFPTREEK